MVLCCVPFCNNTTKKKGSGIKFYEFPSDPELTKKWITVISRSDESGNGLWIPSSGGRDVVCGIHFNPDDFKTGLKIKRLKPGTFPTVFPGYPQHKQIAVSHMARSLERTPPLQPSIINENIFKDSELTSLQPCSSNDRAVRDSETAGGETPQTSVSSGNIFRDSGPADGMASQLCASKERIVQDSESAGRLTPQHHVTNGTIFKVSETADRPLVVSEPISQDYETTNRELVFVELHPGQCGSLTEDVPSLQNSEESCVDTMRTQTVKLLAKKRALISRLKKKIAKMKAEHSVLEATVNDPCVQRFLALKKKAERGDESALFTMELVKAHGRKRFRWSDVALRHCISWRAQSTQGYEFCRQRKILKLPSRTTVERFSGKSDTTSVIAAH